MSGHPLTTRRVSTADACRECHIVFVSQSENGRLDSILSVYKGRPILTVSDLEHFAQRGGTIALVTDDKRVRLQINPEVATAAGLVMSSKLLGLAQVVPAGRTP